MSMLLSFIASHLLTIVEHEIIAIEPEAVALFEKEIALLINKLETYISKKSPSIESAVKPALDLVGTMAGASIGAAGAAALSQMSQGA